MIIVVSLYHFGYSLLMICLVSWSNIISFLNGFLVVPKRLFNKNFKTTENFFYRKCEIMRLTHFRIEYSGSSPQLKPHTSRRNSSEKLYVFQKQFSCHCALRKSRWVMCLFFLQNRLLHFSVWEEHRQSIASNFVVGPTVCLIYVLGIWPYGMAVLPVLWLNL